MILGIDSNVLKIWITLWQWGLSKESNLDSNVKTLIVDNLREGQANSKDPMRFREVGHLIMVWYNLAFTLMIHTEIKCLSLCIHWDYINKSAGFANSGEKQVSLNLC
jgi:hypothetical protein